MMNELEQLRKKALFTLLGIGGCLLLFLVMMVSMFPGPYLMFALMAALFILVLIGSSAHNKYATAVKNQVLVKELEKEFDNVLFDSTRGFDRDYLASTELVSMGNRFSSNDYLEGNYKGVHFSQSDVHIQQHTKTGKSSTTVTLFKGRWLIYRFNKRFTGYLQIRSNENHLFGNGRPYRFFSSRPDTERIRLENETFNEMFNVYASDEHEAYYILTPHFMEKLMRLAEETEGNLVCGFIDDRLHVTVYNNRDAFEPSLFTPVDESYMAEIHQDIALIQTIVDDLTLDNNLYV